MYAAFVIHKQWKYYKLYTIFSNKNWQRLWMIVWSLWVDIICEKGVGLKRRGTERIAIEEYYICKMKLWEACSCESGNILKIDTAVCAAVYDACIDVKVKWDIKDMFRYQVLIFCGICQEKIWKFTEFVPLLSSTLISVLWCL